MRKVGWHAVAPGGGNQRKLRGAQRLRKSIAGIVPVVLQQTRDQLLGSSIIQTPVRRQQRSRSRIKECTCKRGQALARKLAAASDRVAGGQNDGVRVQIQSDRVVGQQHCAVRRCRAARGGRDDDLLWLAVERRGQQRVRREVDDP